MLICPACQGQIRETARYCPHCGHHIDEGAALTMTTPGEPETRMASRGSLPLSGAAAFDYGPLTPGATFAGRYRILALLGRGGMGEVYRADDLTLGQAVALKFLPDELDADPGRLQRFLQEVRLSRQVSHPNVCRVYDIGEANGRHFLSMEFVDGEDLSSLLRRIGRLPPDKAAEITRQLCAGLAAAHEKGVLHRDLKPSNIMLDGRGKVRLTDFGLAQMEASGGAAQFAGTPAYMAPEQLEGQPASVKSDLYALGLVIHEIFTGKRVFDANTIDDLRKQHRDVSSRTLSSTVRDVDPAVERIVERCLEKDPARRPSSALGVAAALPGGDPLAAALAAGETPSPELVAAAGRAEGLRPLIGMACLGGVLLALVALGMVSSTKHLFSRVRLDRPPAVLVERAREVIRRLGYPDPPADSAAYLTWDPFYLRHIAERDRSASRWAGLETTPVVFLVYRQSPRELVAFTPSGRVTGSQPPEDVSGMASAWIDRQGRLVVFSAEPPQYVESPVPSGAEGPVPSGAEGPVPGGVEGTLPSVEADWAAAFAEARLDLSQFISVPPKWVPPMACDRRVAWEGNYPSQPPVPVHIEGASFLGKPVYFNIRGPWDVPSRQAVIAPSLAEQIGQGIAFAIILLAAVAAALLARRNWRAGRGDPTGATRLATFVFAVLMIAWAVGADHASSVQNEVPILIIALSQNTLIAVTVWAVYMALEPFVRRRWPHMLITWTRVLTGRVTDPLVGRDVLVGVLAGAITALLINLQSVVPTWLGQPPPAPVGGPPPSAVIAILGYGVFQALAALFLLLMLRMVVRKDWIAATLLIMVRSLAVLPGGGDVLTSTVLNALAATIAFGVLFRVGLLALTVGTIVANLLIAFPVTLDWTVWYAPAAYAVLVIVAGLATAGFYTSLAGQSLFNASLLED